MPVVFCGRRQRATSPARTNESPAVAAKPATSQGFVSWSLVKTRRDGDRRLDERHDARKREAQCPHGSRFTTASPERSAFAMKPRAPLDAINDP